jgi:hypothetical protein
MIKHPGKAIKGRFQVLLVHEPHQVKVYLTLNFGFVIEFCAGYAKEFALTAKTQRFSTTDHGIPFFSWYHDSFFLGRPTPFEACLS